MAGVWKACHGSPPFSFRTPSPATKRPLLSETPIQEFIRYSTKACQLCFYMVLYFVQNEIDYMDRTFS